MDLTNAKIKVKEELNALRQSAIDKANYNKKLALSNPNYAKLNKTEKELILKISKLKAEDKKTDELDKEFKKTQLEREKVLKSLGLTSADLSPNFSCKKCNDLGITSQGLCSCFKEKIAKYLTPQTTQNLATFNDFKILTKNETQKNQLLKLKDFLISFAQGKLPYLNIVLSGQVGVGKTFLGECTLSEFKKQNKSVFKISSFSMNELFTKFHTTLDYSKQDYLDILLSCDVLLIDDLGTEPIKRNITLEYLYLILNERLNANKKTIITTNLGLEDILAIYQERIFSRLANKNTTKLFKLEGLDLRLQK